MKSLTRDQIISGKGLTASIALHALVLGMLIYAYQNALHPQHGNAVEEPRQHIVVSFQQRKSVVEQPDVPAPDIPPANAEPIIAEAPANSLRDGTGIVSEATSVLPASESGTTSSVPETITTEENKISTAEATANDNTLTASSIRSSVTAYAHLQQDTYSGAWVSACLIYQKELCFRPQKIHIFCILDHSA